MKNIATMLGLLIGAFLIARGFGATTTFAGRIGIAAVFAFTALGHFVKRKEMLAMMPATVPARSALVLLSGALEFALAGWVLIPAWANVAGIALCVFLVLVTPVNIYAAVQRVDFGGHAAGPRYLVPRLLLQLLLLAWTAWFTVLSGQ